jgi:hypothetical protein
VFSIKIQGKTVAGNFDIAAADSQPVFQKFTGIPVRNKLKLEFIPQKPNPKIHEMPVLHLLEIIREDDSTALPAIPRLSLAEAQKLNTTAWKFLEAKNETEARQCFHQLFDQAPNSAVEKQALDGMAALGHTESISRIAKYCLTIDPVLWNFDGPDPDAVQSATKALVAVATNTTTGRENAIKLLDHAFKIAGTLEIRERVVAGYAKLGIRIDKDVTEKGFLTHWQILGPFFWDEGNEPLDKKYINEPEINLTRITTRSGKQLDWVDYVSDKPMINLRQIIGELDMVAAYAYTEFELDAACELLLKVGSNDGFKCWLNAVEIGRFDGGRGWVADQDIYKVRAKKGTNKILLKISQFGDSWGFSVRLTDLKDQPILLHR